jgi:histidinol-phosphatase
MNADWQVRYERALEAAEQAARLALGYFPDLDRVSRPAPVEWKADQSPVTIADRETENLLRSTLLEAFPNDAFLGEEHGAKPGSTGFRWIIDPIDGTRSFVRGIPLWATLVGLEYLDEQIAGVAVAPALGHTYRALRGDGAFRGNRPIQVSKVNTLDQAMLFHCSLRWFIQAGRENALLQLSELTQRQRGFGDFFGFVLLAQGSGELVLENGTHPWDLAALKVILEEAGGRLTSWDGTADIFRPDTLASNGLLHEAALRIMNGEKTA